MYTWVPLSGYIFQCEIFFSFAVQVHWTTLNGTYTEWNNLQWMEHTDTCTLIQTYNCSWIHRYLYVQFNVWVSQWSGCWIVTAFLQLHSYNCRIILHQFNWWRKKWGVNEISKCWLFGITLMNLPYTKSDYWPKSVDWLAVVIQGIKQDLFQTYLEIPWTESVTFSMQISSFTTEIQLFLIVGYLMTKTLWMYFFSLEIFVNRRIIFPSTVSFHLLKICYCQPHTREVKQMSLKVMRGSEATQGPVKSPGSSFHSEIFLPCTIR